jgi:hypothetical protein
LTDMLWHFGQVSLSHSYYWLKVYILWLHIYITGLVLNAQHYFFSQKRGAQLVVLEGKRRQVWENVWSESCLDLHLMSSGAARAMVHAWLLNVRAIVFEGHEVPKLLRYAIVCSCIC